MKALTLALLLACAGCCSTEFYALQPGDEIVRPSTDLADEFRDQTGNDPDGYGETWVEITKPTLIIKD